IVLATGGGAVLDADSRRVLSAHGYVVYLHAPIEQQLHRTARADNRPLLNKVADRRGVLSALLAQRDPLYREIADLIVDTDSRSAKALVHEIEQGLDGGPSSF
ncbi:MAG TPA: shikimate kinase, partial [Solimonas sp.]